LTGNVANGDYGGPTKAAARKLRANGEPS
jgi:hypothetical protein